MAAKPTLLFIAYGTNESFAGEAGLPRFVDQFNRLLDDLSPSKARVVLIAPPQFEEATWKGGDLARRKQDIKRYSEAIHQIAEQRHDLFVDDVSVKYSNAFAHTDNGVHFTAYGYWSTSGNLMTELHVPVRRVKLVELDGVHA